VAQITAKRNEFQWATFSNRYGCAEGVASTQQIARTLVYHTALLIGLREYDASELAGKASPRID
jgi:hypothetical protein